MSTCAAGLAVDCKASTISVCSVLLAGEIDASLGMNAAMVWAGNTDASQDSSGAFVRTKPSLYPANQSVDKQRKLDATRLQASRESCC